MLDCGHAIGKLRTKFCMEEEDVEKDLLHLAQPHGFALKSQYDLLTLAEKRLRVRL